jgi:hypothetical protein
MKKSIESRIKKLESDMDNVKIELYILHRGLKKVNSWILRIIKILKNEN